MTKIDRTGYCCWCKHNPELPLNIAATLEGNPCKGCWFTESKSNWEESRVSIFVNDSYTTEEKVKR